MGLNKLDNFIKNTEGRILYVSPSDLDSTDSISNQGNSLAQPFKTLQRALLEAARFSYQKGNSNDDVEKTTILLMPGQHTVDNRPGFSVFNDNGTAKAVSPSGATSNAIDTLSLKLDSVFDLTQDDNILYKFNSINGGVVVPRGTSIVGLDLRKTKIRPKYVPNPTDSNVPNSAIFRITGACYFWQFCIFDGSTEGTVYTDPTDFSVNNQSVPTFSHHKLTCFEYADGVNLYEDTGLTDLDMYYAKLSNAFNLASGRDIDDKYPANPLGFEKQRPEWEIVGAFATDPIQISTIESGSGGTASSQVTVKTTVPHKFTAGTPIKISGVSPVNYNISTKVQSISDTDPTVFTYLLPNFPPNLTTPGNPSSGFVTIETDTVSGASPYIFNISMRSVYGMNGMLADGSKASGFRSMVVAQFTGVSLQKDDRAFVRYNPTNRDYSDNITITREAGATLSSNSSSLGTVYHLEPLSIYRSGWESSHIKATNDSFIQIVSVFAIGFNKHFDAESGGDLSITNSNSNFGQISLTSSGFKKEAFAKDNKAFITSIIAPRAIVEDEQDIDWFSLDVGITTNTTINPGQNRLYLYGFTSQDDIPPTLTQGYRIGAKVSDKIYFAANGTEYSANILMSDDVTSSVKEYSVTGSPSSNIFTLGTHNIQTGEKVIILSDDGDLPENIVENTVYYAIRHSSTQIKLASSQSASVSGNAISVYKGTSLRILSRVSDKIAGDVGHPVQFDTTNGQWYIITNAGSGIYTAINSLGVAGLTERTEPSYVKRTEDTRSLDEKLYKIRVVIPKELVGAKNPEDGFVIQESSSTGYRNNTDFSLSSLTESDYEYNKNPRFISNCSRASSTVTVISELPHNLQVGDSIIIKNVTDSTNTTGEDDRGYNGTFAVASVVDDMTFTHTTTRTPGTTFTNVTSNRTTLSPRLERNNLQSNLYNYRSEVITPYISGIQDGVYHIYTLSADKAVPEEFTNIKYSQNVVDLYAQLDRDNVNDNPPPSKTFAKRSPLGEVVTNDLKKSITKESTDTLLTTLGCGLDVSNVSSSTSSATITFARRHGLAGIVTFSTLIAGASYTSGTYQNLKLLNTSQTGTWRGATARVVVSGGAVISADVVSSGSGYSAGPLFFDASVVGNGNGVARFNIATSGITTAIGNVVQFTGTGTTSDTYHRITAVSADNQISIAKTAGDPVVTQNQYAFIVGPSVQITTTTYSSGISTFNCSGPHGLVAGNRFRVTDSSNNNRGDYIVKDRIDFDTFTAFTPTISVNGGYILKHGLSANDASSDSTAENLAIRSVPLFDKETLVAASGITTTALTVAVSSPVGSAAITKRFPLGSYIQVDEEIMRVASSTLSGGGGNQITVIRGALATKQTAHDSGSLIRKIKPISIEFRRPSIVRASGHTFEYLGYGPGNYSTGLPQVQSVTLTEREEFLVQSQERSGGIVVYTGMNNNGDSFIGNRKTSSSTGEEVTFDNPIPTVTGEDPSRLSAVFDEVTIKERLVVEGGNSGTVLSQFDGPVTFNSEVRVKGNLTLGTNSILKITNPSIPASITGDLLVGDGLTVGGTSTLAGQVTVNTGIIPDADEGAYLGSSTRPFSEAWVGEIGIATGTTDAEDRTIRAITGNLTLAATTGNSVAISTSASVTGDLNVTGTISAAFLDVPNVAPIGSVVMWPSASSPPTNWRFCNGTQLSQTTYSELFALIGTTYNTGGETVGNFRVPDLGNRFVVGTGPSYGLNATGGAATVALQVAQLPTHTHGHTMDLDGLHNHGGTNQGGDHNHTIQLAGGHSHGGATNGGGGHSHGGDTLNGGGHSHGMQAAGVHSHPYLGPDNQVSSGNNPSPQARRSNVTLQTNPAGSHTHGIDAAAAHIHQISAEANHTHPITAEPQHIHTAVAAPQHIHPITQDASHNHGLTINPAGSNGAHENLPPYRSLYYIIRII
jgi:microcystin-dependent protein